MGLGAGPSGVRVAGGRARTRACISQLGFIKISGPGQLMCDASRVCASRSQNTMDQVTRFDETHRSWAYFLPGRNVPVTRCVYARRKSHTSDVFSF